MTARRLHLGTAVICFCLVAMWLIIAYVIGQDSPQYVVPADIRPVPSYSPFTHTPQP